MKQGFPYMSEKSGGGDSDDKSYKVFPLEFVIKKLLDYGEDQAVNRVK